MIPTLQKWGDDATAAEFWAKHDEQQALLDAQGAPEPAEPVNWVAAEYTRQFMHDNVAHECGRRHANSIIPKVLK